MLNAVIASIGLSCDLIGAALLAYSVLWGRKGFENTDFMKFARHVRLGIAATPNMIGKRSVGALFDACNCFLYSLPFVRSLLSLRKSEIMK